MATPKDRLRHLLDLAAQGGDAAQLAREVAELLLDWPEGLPHQVRAAFLQLLEKAAGDETAEAADPAPDASALVAAARSQANGAFRRALADITGISFGTAEAILTDESGEALAVLCKGARLPRAAFSALALIGFPGGDALARLSIYDAIPTRAAERIAHSWRTAPAPLPKAAE